MKQHRIVNCLALLMLLAPFVFPAPAQAEDLTRQIEDFYAVEEGRWTAPAPRKTPPAFDIIILHICSLGWDDLDEAGLRGDPFFKQFDFLFTDYNSVTAHSGPAVIRLLRAGCGQQRHGDLYNRAGRDCYLYNMVSDAGFAPATLLNHDGKYGGFVEDIELLGSWKAAPIDVGPLAPAAYLFDDSPIYGNHDVLARWLKTRTPASPTALYYNSVSLHDGTRAAGDKQWWKRDRAKLYARFAKELFADVTRFMEALEQSGRKTVVVFVGEHGLGLREDGLAKRGDRETPLPRITQVPLAVKLIGGRRLAGAPLVIDKPVTHFAVGHLIARFIETDPFANPGEGPRAANSVPATAFVADNGGPLILDRGGTYFLCAKENACKALGPDAARKAVPAP